MKYFYTLSAILILFLTSCVSSGEEEEEAPVGPQQQLYVNLSIPADEDKDGRAWGDPGSPGIPNELPRYLYIFIVIEKGTGNFQVEKYEGNGRCEGSWTKVKEENALLWKYTPIIISMNTVNPGNQSKVYAIASYDALPDVENAVVKTKDDLEKLIFYWPSDNNFNALYHIYANAKNDPANGAIIKSGSESSAKVRCNHVLAKVDIQWNIAPEKMKTYAMREIKLTGLASAGYYFQPTVPLLDEVNDKIQVSRHFDVGNQWYGRGVFYVIDRNAVKCTYTLGGTDYVGYPVNPEEEMPQNDPSQLVIQRVYGSTNSGNEQAPDGGNISNRYTSWYRINAKFGYQP